MMVVHDDCESIPFGALEYEGFVMTTRSFTFGIGFSFETKFKTRLDSYRN